MSFLRRSITSRHITKSLLTTKSQPLANCNLAFAYNISTKSSTIIMTAETKPQEAKTETPATSVDAAVVEQQEQQPKKQKLNDQLKVYKRSENATLPTKGSALAAGYDIYASAEALIPAQGQGLVSTDISIIVPIGTYGRVAPRSGLTVKHGISTGAGVIDADYRGEVKVALFNHSKEDFEIKKGDRIAQLVLEKIVNADIVEIEQSELDNTSRGEGGFGSTGN